MPEDEFISKPMSPNYAPSQPFPTSTSSTDNFLSLFVTSAEVHPPSKEVPLSQEDDSSSTTDQMPAGSFQQETRELATACWDPQEEEDSPPPSETEEELFSCHKILTVVPAHGSLYQSRTKIKSIVDGISMEGMTWGDSELQDVGHGNPEYVVHFTHCEGFPQEDLQNKIEDHAEFVKYTFIVDPDEEDPYDDSYP